MNRFGNHSREAPELRGAWQSWQSLETEANRFLAISNVSRALSDDAYRVSTFREPWPKGVNAAAELQKKSGSRFEGYDDVAEAYRFAANNTQKLLDRQRSQSGMRNMTVIMENMNLLLEGSTLHSDYETIEFLPAPETIQSIDGLRIHAVLALKLLLSVAHGNLRPDKKDVLVTESHALHAIVTHEGNRIQQCIPRTNQIGTKEELEEVYGYGNTQGKDLMNRLQGARFRAIELREQAEEVLSGSASAQGWVRPKNSVGTLLMSEVCTAKALEKTRPTFFEGQWGIGPVSSSGQSIDFKRGNIREQILNALPLIAETILHYPQDNPVIKTS